MDDALNSVHQSKRDESDQNVKRSFLLHPREEIKEADKYGRVLRRNLSRQLSTTSKVTVLMGHDELVRSFVRSLDCSRLPFSGDDEFLDRPYARSLRTRNAPPGLVDSATTSSGVGWVHPAEETQRTLRPEPQPERERERETLRVEHAAQFEELCCSRTEKQRSVESRGTGVRR